MWILSLSAHSILFLSAEAAGLVALTKACCLFQVIIIYTDSPDAFGVAYDSGQIWHTHGFKGKGHYISGLLEASTLPKHLAVNKIKG